jgi:hypothetical protein
VTEQHSDTVVYTLPTNSEIRASLAIGVDQAQIAPTHCPVCLSRILTPRTKPTPSGASRRYRRCPAGCYTDTAVLVIVRSAIHETD